MPPAASRPPADAPCTTTDPSPSIRYGKSHDRPTSSPLAALQAIAGSLKEAQLRVALALAAAAEPDPNHSAAISTRKLAKAANLSESALPGALRALEERQLITIRHGTATRGNAYRVNFLSTLWGASFREAPPASPTEAPPPLFEMQGASFAEAPPTENTALADAAISLKISSASLQLIDRVLSAKKANFDPELLGAFRRWLHAYMCKLGRDDNNRPLAEQPPPPPDDLVAQFLSIADPRRLGTLLDSLMCDRQSCYSYGWFVTVALQRIHGLHFQEQKKARAALALVRRGGKAQDPEWQQQTLDDLASIAHTKALR